MPIWLHTLNFLIKGLVLWWFWRNLQRVWLCLLSNSLCHTSTVRPAWIKLSVYQVPDTSCTFSFHYQLEKHTDTPFEHCAPWVFSTFFSNHHECSMYAVFNVKMHRQVCVALYSQACWPKLQDQEPLLSGPSHARCLVKTWHGNQRTKRRLCSHFPLIWPCSENWPGWLAVQ